MVPPCLFLMTKPQHAAAAMWPSGPWAIGSVRSVRLLLLLEFRSQPCGGGSLTAEGRLSCSCPLVARASEIAITARGSIAVATSPGDETSAARSDPITEAQVARSASRRRDGRTKSDSVIASEPRSLGNARKRSFHQNHETPSARTVSRRQERRGQGRDRPELADRALLRRAPMGARAPGIQPPGA
jgi:hypothetical protein